MAGNEVDYPQFDTAGKVLCFLGFQFFSTVRHTIDALVHVITLILKALFLVVGEAGKFVMGAVKGLSNAVCRLFKKKTNRKIKDNRIRQYEQ